MAECTEYTYLLGSYTPAFLYTSEAIGIVELTCQCQSESHSPLITIVTHWVGDDT